MNYLSMSYQKIRHNFQALAFSCALGVGLCFSFIITPVNAYPESTETAGVSWESLSPQQQETLASVKDQWSTLPVERQQRLSNGAKKWATMDPCLLYTSRCV